MDLLLIVRQDNKYDDCGSQMANDDDDETNLQTALTTFNQSHKLPTPQLWLTWASEVKKL